MAEQDQGQRMFKTPDLKQKYESAVLRYGPELGEALYEHAYRPMLERVHSDEMRLKRTPFYVAVFRELRVANALDDETRGAKALQAIEEASIEIAAKNIRLHPPRVTRYRSSI